MRKKFQNYPLAYDYHGILPLDTPFNLIRNNNIDIYLDLDTTTGKDTCGQNCEHCWFVAYNSIKNRKFETNEGKKIFDSLKKQGFNVYPRYADSFAYDGELLRLYGNSEIRNVKTLESNKEEAHNNGVGWTSGKPIMSEKGDAYLDLFVEHGFDTITITFHGIIDNMLEVQEEYPIKAVFHGKKFLNLYKKIQHFNQKSVKKIDINIGITIGTHNHAKEQLIHYIYYFNKLNIKLLRFNNFYAHNTKYKFLELTYQQKKDFFADIKWIHDSLPINFQLAVSEDFGTIGYEVLDYPENIGICKGGHQLFAIIPKEQLENTDKTIIGTVVGCVNTFEPVLGVLRKKLNTEGEEYQVEFDYNEITKLQHKRLHSYKNGCFSKELSEDILMKKY